MLQWGTPNMNRKEIFKFLRELYIFNALQDHELQSVVRIFESRTYLDGEMIFREGDTGDYFYLIVSGNVVLSRLQEGPLGTLGRKDNLGEEALLYDQPHSATAAAQGDCVLLRINQKLFYRLLEKYPPVYEVLRVLTRSCAIAREKKFPWLRENELIRIIQQKHIAVVVQRMLLPAFFTFIALVVLSLLSVNMLLYVLPPIFFIFSVIWLWIDWGNDYYIVTNQRLVWIEKVIWFSDQHNEAPLESILSVNTRSNQFQRWLGYADVVVRTYTGNITMRDVAHPQQLADIITAYWYLAEERAGQQDISEVRTALRRRLGYEETPPEELHIHKIEAPPVRNSTSELDNQEGGLFSGIEHLFKTRFEIDGVITYRKHLFVLFKELWFLVLVFIGLVLFLIARLVNLVSFPSTRDVFMLNLIYILVSGPFWLYKVLDWANDRFMLTRDEIIDIDKKPLGREEKRSAPLDNILSLDFKRANIIQRMFNYGTVSINVGDVKLDFNNVARPDLVQQEISDYLYAARRRKEEQDNQRRREDMVEFLAAYHEESQQEEYPSDGEIDQTQPDYR
jgi:uncharacterized membrane protein YdbT with pleckstrin-like domain